MRAVTLTNSIAAVFMAILLGIAAGHAAQELEQGNIVLQAYGLSSSSTAKTIP